MCFLLVVYFSGFVQFVSNQLKSLSRVEQLVRAFSSPHCPRHSWDAAIEGSVEVVAIKGKEVSHCAIS
jgi:hypothetical protein